MPAHYEQYRERLLLREESFASFLYLDTRGFLTSGLGYLLVRDAPDAAPGAAIQTRAVSLLTQVGIVLTAAHQATMDALVRAMNVLPAAYPYPAYSKLTGFVASPLGAALNGKLRLSLAKTESGAWTFKVDQALTPTGWAVVEPLFADATRHAAYFDQFSLPYESSIDQALQANPGVVLTDSQRLGLFSAVWNLPRVASRAVAGLARNASYDEMAVIVKTGRSSAAPARLELETQLITGRREIDDIFR